jgi:hypothetical protein
LIYDISPAGRGAPIEKSARKREAWKDTGVSGRAWAIAQVYLDERRGILLNDSHFDEFKHRNLWVVD